MGDEFGGLMMPRGSRGGCRQLKFVLEGGTMHPIAVITCRLANLLFSAKRKEDEGREQVFLWQKTPGAPTTFLRRLMRMMGWEEESEWTWWHPCTREEVDINSRNGMEDTGGKTDEEEERQRRQQEHRKEKKKIAHAIREGFRAWQWQRYWERSKRHEVKMFKDTGQGPIQYDSNRTEATRQLTADAINYAIFTGGVRSPACFQNCDKFCDRCPCCGELGTHEHVFWQCNKVQERLGKRPTPVDEWQKRYGWPSGNRKRKNEDDHVLDWMRKVTNLIWDTRYHNEERWQTTQQKIQGRMTNRSVRREDDRRKDEEAAAMQWIQEGEIEEDEDGDDGDDETEEEDEEEEKEAEEEEEEETGRIIRKREIISCTSEVDSGSCGSGRSRVTDDNIEHQKQKRRKEEQQECQQQQRQHKRQQQQLQQQPEV